MHTHAGDLRKDGHLRGTHGCLRISQEDIDALKMISDELEEQGDFMDYLEVDDDLENPIDDIQSRGDIFYKQTHFNEFNYSHEETTIQQPEALRYMNAFIQELEEKESKNK